MTEETAGAPTIDIVFDGPPSHESGRFVEVEDSTGRSINAGEWICRSDGFWVLRMPDPSEVAALTEELRITRGMLQRKEDRARGLETGTPITEDFVEHSHPQYGMGYFCTEDVLAKVAALTAERERPGEMDALLMGSLPLGMCTEGPTHALRNLIGRAGALQAELDAAKRALAEMEKKLGIALAALKFYGDGNQYHPSGAPMTPYINGRLPSGKPKEDRGLIANTALDRINMVDQQPFPALAAKSTEQEKP